MPKSALKPRTLSSPAFTQRSPTAEGKLFVSRTTQTSFHLTTKESHFILTQCDIPGIIAVLIFKGLFFEAVDKMSGSNGLIWCAGQCWSFADWDTTKDAENNSLLLLFSTNKLMQRSNGCQMKDNKVPFHVFWGFLAVHLHETKKEKKKKTKRLCIVLQITFEKIKSLSQ